MIVRPAQKAKRQPRGRLGQAVKSISRSGAAARARRESGSQQGQRYQRQRTKLGDAGHDGAGTNVEDLADTSELSELLINALGPPLMKAPLTPEPANSTSTAPRPQQLPCRCPQTVDCMDKCLNVGVAPRMKVCRLDRHPPSKVSCESAACAGPGPVGPDRFAASAARSFCCPAPAHTGSPGTRGNRRPSGSAAVPRSRRLRR